MKLNLGAGQEILAGWVNQDGLKLPGIDAVFDLNKFPYPLDDNTFDEVYASHVLEHVVDLPKVLAELKRICKPGAIIKVRGPHFSCGVSWRDPDHKRLFSIFTFDYFSDYSFYAPVKFKIKSRKFNFTRTQFTFLNPILNPILNSQKSMQAIYERFFCWLLPAAEVIVELEVLK